MSSITERQESIKKDIEELNEAGSKDAKKLLLTCLLTIGSGVCAVAFEPLLIVPTALGVVESVRRTINLGDNSDKLNVLYKKERFYFIRGPLADNIIYRSALRNKRRYS